MGSETPIYTAMEIDASTDLVHTGTGGEFAGLTKESSPVVTDKLLIEKTADSNNKYYIEIGDLPASSGFDSLYIHQRIDAIGDSNFVLSSEMDLQASLHQDSLDQKLNRSEYNPSGFDSLYIHQRVDAIGDSNFVLSSEMDIPANELSDTLLLYQKAMGSDDNYVTDAQLVVIGNTSGTNTGDDPGLENIVEDLTPQLGDDLDLNQFSFEIDVTPTSDHTWTGNEVRHTAGERVNLGDVCYLKSDGYMWKCDADAEATTEGYICIATTTINADQIGTFLEWGYLRDDTFNYTVGAELYTSVTPGSPTETAPSGTGDMKRRIGQAITADVIFFNPDNTYEEITASSGDTYMIAVWAEENSGLSTGAYEWAFGNGANTALDDGVVIYVESGYTCAVVAMSLKLGGTPTAITVELGLNGVLQGALCDVTCTGVRANVQDDFTPLAIADGDYITFRTTSVSGTTASPNVICAYLKYTED